MAGGRGAWLTNYQFYLGGAGFGKDEISGHDANLSYGGLWAGVKYKPKSLLQYSADVLLGGGELAKNSNSNDTIFVIEPSVNLNLTKYAELVLSLSYRQLSGSNHQTLCNKDLSGASITASAMFGRF